MYSRYRTVEGLEILKRILQNAGFDECDKKDKTKDLLQYKLKEGDFCRIKLGKNTVVSSKLSTVVTKNQKTYYKFENTDRDFAETIELLKNDWNPNFDLKKMKQKQFMNF